MALLSGGDGAAAVVALTAASHAGAGIPCETPVSFTGGETWSCGAEAASPGRAGGLQLNGFVVPINTPGDGRWFAKFGDTLEPAAGSGYQLSAQMISFPAVDPDVPTAPPGPSPQQLAQPVVTSAIYGSFPPAAASSNGQWQCHGVVSVPAPGGSHSSRELAMPLQRCSPHPGYIWRGQPVVATLCETHLLRGAYGVAGSAANRTLALSVSWRYLGLVASRSTIRGALDAEASSPFPFYFASEPTMAAISDRHWVMVMRASADDDDGRRKLSPSDVLKNSTTFSEWDSAIAGYCMYVSPLCPK
eukprot:COSAG01_NODE_3981_length_5461_cov_4.420268_2_plen_303_part_00